MKIVDSHILSCKAKFSDLLAAAPNPLTVTTATTSSSPYPTQISYTLYHPAQASGFHFSYSFRPSLLRPFG